MTATLNLTPEEYRRVCSAEAICLCEFEQADGSRVASLEAVGSMEEMKAEAARFQLVVRWDGDPKIVGKVAVLSKNLLPPDEELADA